MWCQGRRAIVGRLLLLFWVLACWDCYCTDEAIQPFISSKTIVLWSTVISDSPIHWFCEGIETVKEVCYCTRAKMRNPSPPQPDLSFPGLVSVLWLLQLACFDVAKMIRSIQLGKHSSPGFMHESLSLYTCRQHLSSGLTCHNGDLSGSHESLPEFVNHWAQSKDLDNSIVEELQTITENSVIPLSLNPSVHYYKRVQSSVCSRSVFKSL